MFIRILLSPDDAGSALSAPPAPAPKPSATPPPAPAAPEPTSAPEPSDDPFEMPKKAAAPVSKPADSKGAAPVALDEEKLAPAELRKIAKQRKADLETAGGTIKSLEEKIKALDSRGIDTSALTAQLQSERKEKEQLQAQLRAAKQEMSPDFIKSFDNPINEAAEDAKYEISQFTITDPSGNTRQADWKKDFAQSIFSMDRPEAKEKAKELYGEDWDNVMRHYDNLKSLQRKKEKALEQEKIKFKENTDKEIADQAVNRDNVSKLWVDTNKRLSQLEHYKVDPTDAELAEAAKHAESVFDAKINAADKDDFVKQRVLKDAHVKQKTIGFAVRGIVINRLKEQNAALQKQVDELKGTAPGGTQRPGGSKEPAPGDDSDWEASAQKAMKAAID